MSTIYSMKVAILGVQLHPNQPKLMRDLPVTKSILTYQHESKKTSEKDVTSENQTLYLEQIDSKQAVQIDSDNRIIEEGKLRIQI